MLIIELTYIKSLTEVDKYLKPHIEFLNNYYEQGIFIASGPKNPRDGGMILALSDKETMTTIITEDPFYQQQIADYRIIEFEPNRHIPQFKNIIHTTQ